MRAGSITILDFIQENFLVLIFKSSDTVGVLKGENVLK